MPISDAARGNKSLSVEESTVHITESGNTFEHHPINSLSFADFVAIKSHTSSPTSITHKAVKSFLKAISGLKFKSLDEALRVWIATMIEQQMSEMSRSRYFTKLSAIYNEYCNGGNNEGSPFTPLKKLCNIPLSPDASKVYDMAAGLSKSFADILEDAATRPSLALFLYLLFNASSDLQEAVTLTADRYEEYFPQLNHIIAPGEFHHRRVYLFNLQQSRKRPRQLINETCSSIDSYLCLRNLKVNAGFTPSTITAIWVAKARAEGISMPEIKAVIDVVPKEIPWLNLIPASNLNQTEVRNILRRVADAFCPVTDQWYAMKLKRHTSYEMVNKTLNENLSSAIMHSIHFYYPTKQTVKRKGKKIIKEHSPILSDIVFIKTTSGQLSKIDRIVRKYGEGWIFRKVNTPDSEYSVIDSKSMMLFQRALGQFNPDMFVEMTTQRPVAIGHKVRVTGGDLAGYEGVIYKIRKNDTQRMIYISLSDSLYVKMQVEVDEIFIEPLE